METKQCNDCKEIKSLDEFYTRKKTGTNKIYYNGYCKPCDRSRAKIIKQRNAKKYQANRQVRRATDESYAEHLREQKRISNYKNHVTQMLRNAEARALRKGISFSLVTSDIVVPDRCPLLNVPFVIGTKKDYLYTPTLDRISLDEGYTKSNTRVITMLANSMKNCATKEQLLIFASNIEQYMNN